MEVIREDATDTAKKIRKALKKNFPSYKSSHFKVKTDKYSMGSSVTVHWEDNPARKEVEEVINQYQSAQFDGMQDLETVTGYRDPEDGKMYSGAKYISASYRVSQERDEAVREYLSKNLGMNESEMDYMQWQREYNKTIPKFDDNHNLIEDESNTHGQEKSELDMNQLIRTKVRDIAREEDYHYLYGRIILEDIFKIDTDSYSQKDLEDKYTDEFVKEMYRMIRDIEKEIKGHVEKTEDNESYKDKVNNLVEKYYRDVRQALTGEAINILGYTMNEEMKEEYNKLVDSYGKINAVEEFRKQELSVDYQIDIDELVQNVPYNQLDKNKAVEKLVEIKGGDYWYEADKEHNEIKDLKEEERQKIRKQEDEKEEKTVDIDSYRKAKFTKRDVKQVAEVIKEESKRQGVSSKQLMKKIDQQYLKETKAKDPDNFLDNVREKLREGSDEVNDIESALEEQLGGEDSASEVEKEFGSVRDVSEEVIKYLMDGEVNIVFTKANGAERHMRATRKTELFREYGDLVEGFKESNEQSNVGQEINSGTIGVVDLDIDGGGARKFVTERLKSYQPKGKDKVVVKVVAGESTDEEKEKKHFNPVQKLNTEKMIEILGKKVVRLVFEKKDGSKRAMVATRNPNIVELYVGLDNNGKRPVNRIKEEREGDIKSQIEKDYVKVLDVEKQAFRTFKPSKLVEYDEDLDIASWIEFSEKNDAWYDLAFNGKDPREFYQEGKRTGVNIGNDMSEKVSYEREQKLKIQDEQAARETLEKSSKQAEQSRNRQNQKKEKLKNVQSLVMEEVENVPAQMKMEGFYQLYNEFLKVPEKLEKDKAFNNMENELTKVQKSDERNLVILQIRNDVIFLHPLFIVNGYSGRVYADATRMKIFEDIGEEFKSDADWGSEDILEPLAKKIKTFGRGNKETKGNGKDDLRVERLISLGKENEEKFSKMGVRLFEQKVKESDVKMLGIKMGGSLYFVHPNYMLELREGKTHVIHKNEDNSQVLGYTNFLKGWIESADSEAERTAMQGLMNLIIRGIDLRKRVS